VENRPGGLVDGVVTAGSSVRGCLEGNAQDSSESTNVTRVTHPLPLLLGRIAMHNPFKKQPISPNPAPFETKETLVRFLGSLAGKLVTGEVSVPQAEATIRIIGKFYEALTLKDFALAIITPPEPEPEPKSKAYNVTTDEQSAKMDAQAKAGNELLNRFSERGVIQ